MKNETYLINYFSYHNGVVDRLTLKSKIINRLLAFVICSIIYTLISSSKRHINIYGEEIKTLETIKYIDIVMIICYIIASIGVLFIIAQTLFPSQMEKVTSKLSFKIKQTIFNCLDWGMILPICATIAVFCYSYIFVITPITGTSMNPTIDNGENVLVSYLDNIDQFDVVVLKVTPEDNFEVFESSYYIKRIIGLPGQTVTWIDKVLTIDGEVVNESFFPDDYLDSISVSNSSNFYGNFRYKENNEIKNSFVIPEGYYFVMGDNRHDGGSKDSRLIGLIPEKNIVGVAKCHLKGIIPWGKIK